MDEDAQTVTVDGGVQTRVLLDYLATHMCAAERHVPRCMTMAVHALQSRSYLARRLHGAV